MIVINSVVNMYHVWTGTTILTLVVYWTVGTLYLLLDVFNRPQFLRKYKVQPGTNEPVELHRLGPVINHFFLYQFPNILAWDDLWEKIINPEKWHFHWFFNHFSRLLSR